MASSFQGGLLDEIYQRLDPRRLFQKLELTERGARFTGRCPSCGQKSLYVLRYDPRYPGLKARCNRLNHCGFALSAWDYLRQVEGVAEADVLRTLAERAGVDLSKRKGADPERAAEAWRRRERRAALCERFWTWATERLWAEARHPESEAARTVAFLEARGYGEPLARAMGLAYLPPAEQARAFLSGEPGSGVRTPEDAAPPSPHGDLQGLPFLDPAFERRDAAGARIYTLAIPYPELRSLVARATVADLPDDAPKYRYPKGLKLDAPAYLRAVDRRKAVVVVEGFLDAALAHALAGGEAAGSAPPGTQPPASRPARRDRDQPPQPRAARSPPTRGRPRTGPLLRRRRPGPRARRRRPGHARDPRPPRRGRDVLPARPAPARRTGLQGPRRAAHPARRGGLRRPLRDAHAERSRVPRGGAAGTRNGSPQRHRGRRGPQRGVWERHGRRRFPPPFTGGCRGRA